ncbi:hypothetical protein [Streptomyces sp. ALB3]|uniref:hypothetical protein n=1 Tax=Streptomyces sp. ALB3 TaxID=3374278 RepID=UPI00379A1191
MQNDPLRFSLAEGVILCTPWWIGVRRQLRCAARRRDARVPDIRAFRQHGEVP